MLKAALAGAHIEFEGVVYSRSARVKFGCENALAEVDGNVAGYVDSLTFEVKPGLLRIAAPRGSG